MNKHNITSGELDEEFKKRQNILYGEIKEKEGM